MAAAALVWSLVGLALLVAGAWFAIASGWDSGVVATAAGLALGFIKGRYLLAKMARGNATRMVAGPGNASIFTAFPLSSWGIAAFFMTVGLVLRRSGLSPRLLGFLYVAAGFGLVVASLSGWRAWKRFGGGVTNP